MGFSLRRTLCVLPVLALLGGCNKEEAAKPGAPAIEPIAPAAVSYNKLPALPASNPILDVWKLRSEVARVEAVDTSSDTDGCYREGDPEEEESQEVIKERQASEQACVENIQRKYAEYQHAREAFNNAWLPVMMDAIRKGDLVAEVIMRQCGITPVFDRSGIESSCDPDPQRRIIAAKRLREIGFAPAFDLEGEAMAEAKPVPANRPARVQPARREVQQRLLDRFRQGIFSPGDYEMVEALHTGNSPQSPEELEDIRRSAVIDAVLQDVQHAFTYSSGRYSAGWHTDAFSSLRLNRTPQTPGYLTWGHKLYYGGLNSYWTGPHYWRSGPLKVYLQYSGHSEVLIAHQGDAAFIGMLRETLAAAEANIARYLAQDKRWGVFLLHRVGLHEWVPEGMESDTGKLGKEWQGTWRLEKTFADWKTAPSPAGVSVTIYAEGAATRIKYPAGDAAPGEPPCELRYSGGQTYAVGLSDEPSSSTRTPLGYLPAISGISQFEASPVEPFAPLDPKKSYPQVLVQCPQGESFDTERVRFLLLAGDTLLEVAQEPGSRRLAMFHYRRGAAQ